MRYSAMSRPGRDASVRTAWLLDIAADLSLCARWHRSNSLSWAFGDGQIRNRITCLSVML